MLLSPSKQLLWVNQCRLMEARRALQLLMLLGATPRRGGSVCLTAHSAISPPPNNANNSPLHARSPPDLIEGSFYVFNQRLLFLLLTRLTFVLIARGARRRRNNNLYFPVNLLPRGRRREKEFTNNYSRGWERNKNISLVFLPRKKKKKNDTEIPLRI